MKPFYVRPTKQSERIHAEFEKLLVPGKIDYFPPQIFTEMAVPTTVKPGGLLKLNPKLLS